MTILARLDLANLEPELLENEDLQEIKSTLMAHFGYMIVYPVGRRLADKVTLHISQHLELLKFPFYINDVDSAVAFALKRLPDFVADKQGDQGYDQLLVGVLKQALKDENYNNVNLKQRIILIKNYKNRLDFDNNWLISGEKYFEAALAQNLRVAYSYLRQIKNLDLVLNKSHSVDYKACVISSQLVNYINILDYINKNNYSDQIDLFRCRLMIEIGNALNKLKEIANEKPCKTYSAAIKNLLFSCCMAQTAQKELPRTELKMARRIIKG